MTFVMDMIKGIFIGVANIIPGVSGGTMAVSLGIYDKLIGAISNLLSSWKKSLLTLLPIILGCGLGIVGFTYAIEYLLSKHTFVTCMAFVGLILGGVPVLVGTLRREMRHRHRSIGAGGVISFIVLFALAAFLPLLSSGEEVLKTFSATPGILICLFLVGVVASATMVVPGVSGSLVMMILGYYYGIIDTIKNFLDALKALDMPGLIHGVVLLAPFGIGVLLGIFLIAKLITFLFKRYAVPTYCAILGLIAASPFAIFYNTGLFTQLKDLTPLTVILGVAAAVAGAVVTFLMGERSS
ncbi:MAG: DUF368 domain-containing protein [Enterocloster asparagiformis]|nr:DUF368 domain-containing protein [Enterocloster asparagiformis]